MKKNNLCSSKDYDFYTINFPISELQAKRRNRFLYSELGKLHPCFSDDCCFDSHVRFEKKGLKADVVVMQKYKLADYKNKNNGRPVFIKENRNFPYFKYSQKSKLLISFYSLLFVLCFLCAFVCIAVFGKNGAEPVDVVTASENDFSVNNFEYQSPVVVLLENINKLGGNILSFEWTIDGFNEKIIVRVKNVYPENISSLLPDAVFTPVIFENEIPILNIECNSKIPANQNELKNQQPESQQLKTDFRKMLNENHIRTIEETVRPYGVKLSFEKHEQNEQLNLFNKIFDFINCNNLYVSSISIICSNENLNLYLRFTDARMDFQKNVLDALCKNAIVFNKSKSVDKKIISKNEMPDSVKKSDVKVGQLIRSDRTIIEFYKDSNGKIYQRNR